VVLGRELGIGEGHGGGGRRKTEILGSGSLEKHDPFTAVQCHARQGECVLASRLQHL